MDHPNVQRLLNKPVGDISAKVMKLWQLRPEVFLKDNFEIKLDTWQQDVVDLYMRNQRIAMICSKGPGKTFCIASLGWHFFLTNKLPKMAALSISAKNLRSNLWAELAMLGARSDLVIKSATVKSERITLNNYEKISFIDFRSYEREADQSQQASALAGLHASNIMFMIDEGGTIPESIFVTADAALSGLDAPGHKARLLVAANPEVPSGLIYKAAKGLTTVPWATLKVSGDPLDPRRAKRVSASWAQGLIDEYGRDSDYVKVNVLAEYPMTSEETLLTEEEIDASCKRNILDDRLRPYETIMGVDVARGGMDSTVIAVRRGKKVLRIIPLSSNLDGPELAGQVMHHAQDLKVDRVTVDATGGFGFSLLDVLKYQKNFIVEGVNYSSKARDDRKYFNIRSQMYCELRDWVRDNGQLLPSQRLKADLMASRVSFVKGKFRLEDKEQCKKRLGRSPDYSDALAQTFFNPEMDLRQSYSARIGIKGEYTSAGHAPSIPNYTSH